MRGGAMMVMMMVLSINQQLESYRNPLFEAKMVNYIMLWIHRF
jgi:hypothetical protein